MEEEYDVIVCGTGLKESILSGLLSVKGMKVLHIDRNNYYGGDCASVNLTNLYKKFRGEAEPPTEYGHNRDWNVDLIPKFVMANGKLVKILLYTKVTRYLEWKCVDGSFVFQHKKGGVFSSERNVVCKVPATDSEALKSSLMGIFEKKRCKKFLVYVQNYEESIPKTHKDFDPYTKTGLELMKKFKLEANTIDFVGHALCMFLDDGYLEKPAIQCINKAKLYMDSMGRYGNSPFLYPIYGLGGIPEGFSRLAAIHGGTYMLRTDADAIIFNEDGQAIGIESDGKKAMASKIICDPSYALSCEKVVEKGQIIRCICLLDHPVGMTKNAPSCQLIIPQKQLGRNSDIYITMVSASHSVCPKDLFLAMISTNVETTSPESEINPALELLHPIKETFLNITKVYEPISDGTSDNLYITKSYDATSHFETSVDDVLAIYERITGETLDLTNLPEEEEEEY